MAILYKELKPRTRTVVEDGKEVVQNFSVEEKRLINVATIRSALGYRFRITGVGLGEARDLALLLRAGALAAPMYIVEERTVGASLGEDNIRAGLRAAIGGYVLVLLTMVFYYKAFGMIANIALAINVILLVALMSILGATLTMPGIAGIVLTMGMAVDANVLIFSRVREEALERSPQAAITAGFRSCVYDDRRFEPDAPARRARSARLRHRADQGLRRGADARNHHVDVHRDHGDARDGESGVRRPQPEEALGMSEAAAVRKPMRVINFMGLRYYGAAFSIIVMLISLGLDRRRADSTSGSTSPAARSSR